MSAVDELVERLCPDGVEYRALGDIADYVRGVTYSKNQEQVDGPILVLRANNISLASNTLNFDSVKSVSADVRVRSDQMLRADDILISAASGSRDHVGKVAFIDKDLPYCFGGFMAVVRVRSSLEPRFLFHLLTGHSFAIYLEHTLSTTTINNLSSSIMKAFKIPVPPLEVQREIVRILDQFTQLEAELEAELEARRLQYGHYRDELLLRASAGTPHLQLGELGRIVTGRTPKGSDATAWGGCVPFITPTDIKNGMKTVIRTARYLSATGVEGMARVMIPPRSLLVTCIGADMGKTVINAEGCATNQQINTIIPSAMWDVDYGFHVLTAMRARIRGLGERAAGTMPILNKGDFSRIEVSVPTLDVQRDAAAKLDQFDALVNDLTVGVPAEIAARRQQYEHYRDRLLTFKERAA